MPKLQRNILSPIFKAKVAMLESGVIYIQGQRMERLGASATLGLKMETVRFSKTLAYAYESTLCQNPDVIAVRSSNLKVR
jgi:hypothetical protein